MSTEYEFDVSVAADRLVEMYRGEVRYLIVHSREGLKLQLPLFNFRPYVDEAGLHGRFRVIVNESNKIQSLTKLPG